MDTYKVILLAVDLSKESAPVAARAKKIAQDNMSKLHIVHIIEPINYAYNDNILVDMADLQNQIEDTAKKQLHNFAIKYEIPEGNQHTLIGSAASEIHALAKELKADLIVVGSHGQSGLALLLGSTANGVLHGSHCDVLAVRVGK